MNTIWVNRLIAGDRLWSDVPVSRKNAVKEILAQRAVDGVISEDMYVMIVGENREVNRNG